MQNENSHKEKDTMEGEPIEIGIASRDTKGAFEGGWDGGLGWII